MTIIYKKKWENKENNNNNLEKIGKTKKIIE